MRICMQCQSEMIEGFNLRVKGAAYGIKIAKGTGIFADRIEEEPKVAICTKCGELSLYIVDIDKIGEK